MKAILNSIKELMAIDTDLEERAPYVKSNKYKKELYSFPQIWQTTACGMNHFGKETETKAMTYVVETQPKETSDKSETTYFVYFGSEFAYMANWSVVFENDLNDRNLVQVIDSEKYNFYYEKAGFVHEREGMKSCGGVNN